MPLLTPEQFRATFGERPQRVRSDDAPPFDFWPSFEAIPACEFEANECSPGQVEQAWLIPPGRFGHVLVKSENRNEFRVLVLDRRAGEVYGHRLLDLNHEYGLEG